MNTAPIVLFAFNRPRHLQNTLESLAANKLAADSRLFIYCDGPRAQDDTESVSEVRHVARLQKWCGEVTIIEHDSNLGLAKSVSTGVTEICGRFGRVIVLEDDLVLSPLFLDYMNSALTKYQPYARVMQISGFMFQTDYKPEDDAFFLPLVTSWGWGTWRRAWDFFDINHPGLKQLEQNPELRKKFDVNGAYGYFHMLQRAREKAIDSWAVFWYLSVFMQEGLTLYPSRSLVYNAGFDGSGRHCAHNKLSQAQPTHSKINTMPDTIRIDQEALRAVIRYYQHRSHMNQRSLISKIAGKARRIFSGNS